MSKYPPPPLGRLLQRLIGTVVAVTGLGLAGFALLLVYADWLRDLPSDQVVTATIIVCALGGVWCALVGLRLLLGRSTRIDPLLLSPASWQGVGGVFLGLALWLLVRGRLRLALAMAAFGLLCLGGARAVRIARSRWAP